MITSNLGVFDGFYILIGLFNQIINGLSVACENPVVLLPHFPVLIFLPNTECVVRVIQVHFRKQLCFSVLP